MSVFISWSGANSAAVGEAFHQLLRHVLHGMAVFISNDKIRSGSLWFPEIQGGLDTAKFGVVIATPQAVGSPWVLFESGAIWKAKTQIAVGVLRVGLEADALREHPLGQFQSRGTSRSDVLRLVRDIRTACAHNVDDDVLERAFDQNWSLFESVVQKLPKEAAGVVAAPQSEDESLEKIANRLNSVERFILNRADVDQQLLSLVETALRARPIPIVNTLAPEGGIGGLSTLGRRRGLFGSMSSDPPALISGTPVETVRSVPTGATRLKATAKKASEKKDED